MVKNVGVGWAGNAVELELTDTAPQVARVKLAEGIGATGLTPDNTLTDRSVNGAYYLNTILADEFVGTVVPPTGATRVRIVRSAINGSYLHNGVDVTETVFEKVFNLDYHPVLTEMDILGTGKLDLDWSTLLQRWGTGSIAALTNVTYRIVLGEGSNDLGGNNYPLAFVNAFERGAQQTKATINAPKGTIYSGQPEFSWTHVAKDSDGRKVKDYPAFRLRVWKGASGGTAIYDSGAQPAPPRDANGIYRWKAPIYANMKLPSGTVFSTTNNYYWSVSMLDAKFTAPNSDETRQLFRMEASGALGTISDYGAVKACVRYFGPAPVTNVIHVQAYTSPDFTGFPAGEGYVTNKADLASISSLAPNAVILGLKPGTYYLRAYLDSDGNNGWSKWETWGYANYVGTEVTTLYTPRPITLVRGQAIPEVTIYMEDMDTDADTFPDAWEWTKYGSLGKTGSPSGATFFTRVNTNLLAVVNGFQLGSAGKASSVRPMTLMNSMLTGTDADSIAAAVELLGDGSDETAGAEVQVRIDSFSLEGGISLTVTNDAQPGDYGVFTVADSANVDVYLVASNKPDFSDNLPPIKVGTITIAAGKDATESISAEAIADAIQAAGLGDAAFFKVRLEQ